MPTLHIRCDFREPSLSRAVQEARRLGSYPLRVGHLRTAALAEMLDRLASEMGEDDLGLLTLLHTSSEQLREATKVVSRLSLDLRGRLTIASSPYAPEMRDWALRNGMRYEDNGYEAPRRVPWKHPSPNGTTLVERQWIQYRLMRAMIAGEGMETVYTEIIDMLRRGPPSEQFIRRALKFHEQGEPDMAGGSYAEERRHSPNAIDLLRERAIKVGRAGLNTLIIGETGTGKESLAWYLHDFSTRCDHPFLALNCAFFEGERLESELFGHEQGAFTDAKKSKQGLVEVADGGTIFLDELPEMAPRVQAKLLRFLQDGTYSRLGGNLTLRADARIISAAQPHLMTKLRPDLFYRVADVELKTVPLRAMKEKDIVNIGCNLAYRLMWKAVIGEEGEKVVTPDLLREVWKKLAHAQNGAALAKYAWPGNMRELSTLIKRFVLLGDDIFEELKQKPVATDESFKRGERIYDEEWERFLLPATNLAEIEERGLKLRNLQSAYIRHLVEALGGRQKLQPTKLAEALGCTYNTLVAGLGPLRNGHERKKI